MKPKSKLSEMSNINKKLATKVLVEIITASGELSSIEHNGDITNVNIKVNDIQAMILKTFREVFLEDKTEKLNLLTKMLNKYRSYLIYEHYKELCIKRGIKEAISSASQISNLWLRCHLRLDGNEIRSFWGISKYKELVSLRVNMAKTYARHKSGKIRLKLNEAGELEIEVVNDGNFSKASFREQQFRKIAENVSSLDEKQRIQLIRHLLEPFSHSKEKEFIDYLLGQLPH
ncbi:hypothetical protein QRL16_003415 [Vibrio parahaemolyticus]|nr:hypothetical protein [Vibrio parahaemolyticus]